MRPHFLKKLNYDKVHDLLSVMHALMAQLVSTALASKMYINQMALQCNQE